MTTHKQSVQDPKEELMHALRPLSRILWVNNFIKKIQQPQISMPKGKNAHTERFMVALALCFCLFTKNHSSLMKYGNPLRNYTNKYAMQVPITQASLITYKLQGFIRKQATRSRE